MKIYIFIVLLILCPVIIKSQNKISVIIDETNANGALEVIRAARGVNFGDYKGQYGLNYWYLNMDNASIDIKPNNIIVINNISFSGAIDIDLWAFNLTPSGGLTGSIEGRFDVKKNNDSGYFLHFVPTKKPSIFYNGPLQGVVNLILFIVNNFTTIFPDIQINLGNSLLPDLLHKYIQSEIPQIITNDHEIILSFEVLFDEINLENRAIQPGEIVDYKASQSIVLGAGFKVSTGANFSASISSKNDLRVTEVVDTIPVFNEGDSIVSPYDIEYITKADSLDNQLPMQFSMSTGLSKIKERQSLDNSFFITVWDIQGRVLVHKQKVEGNPEDYYPEFLHPGIYIVRYTSQNFNFTKKVIIKE